MVNQNINDNENENMNLKSDILKIEALEKEYKSVLAQYEEAYKNCNSEMKNNLNKKKASFKTFNNRAYWGTSGLKEGSVNSQSDCENMCASDIKCSGATFNTKRNYCWARSGNGILAPSSSVNVALLPTAKGCVLTLKALNNRLIELNQELTKLIENTNSELAKERAKKNNSKAQLHKYYAELLKQRLHMAKILEETQVLDDENNDQHLFVSTQDSSLRVWIIIAAVLSLVVIGKMLGRETSFSQKFWIVIMVLVLIASFSISNASGFSVWCILVLLIVLMRMDIIPSPKDSE
uniref:Apple domain-containing protein n=1 Tax=viral metagenome TaxID=1070528 RepID=A0A6C0I830_9ZZZZ